MVNLMLTWNCRSLLEIIRAIGDIHAVCFHGTCSRCDAALLNPSGGAFADCWRFTGNFHLPFVSSPWRRFFWSPWKTPISTLLHSLWNQFSLFCFYSLWVTMDTAPKWFGLSMNLFTSVNLEWIGMFFFLLCSQSKQNLLTGHSKITLKCFFSFQRLQSIPFGEVRERSWNHNVHYQLHEVTKSSSSALRKKPNNPLNII